MELTFLDKNLTDDERIEIRGEILVSF